MDLQSIKSVKHNAAKSVNRSILKKSRHLGFGVFIVHSSMHVTIAGCIWQCKYIKESQACVMWGLHVSDGLGVIKPIHASLLLWGGGGGGHVKLI